MNFFISEIEKRDQYQIIYLKFVNVPELKDLTISILVSNDLNFEKNKENDIPWFLAKKVWNDFNRSKAYFSLLESSIKKFNLKRSSKRAKEERDRLYKIYLNIENDIKIDYSLINGEYIYNNGSKILLDLVKKDKKIKVDVYGFKNIYMFKDKYGNYFSMTVRSDRMIDKIENNNKIRVFANLKGHYILSNMRINVIQISSSSLIKILE